MTKKLIDKAIDERNRPNQKTHPAELKMLKRNQLIRKRYAEQAKQFSNKAAMTADPNEKVQLQQAAELLDGHAKTMPVEATRMTALQHRLDEKYGVPHHKHKTSQEMQLQSQYAAVTQGSQDERGIYLSPREKILKELKQQQAKKRELESTSEMNFKGQQKKALLPHKELQCDCSGVIVHLPNLYWIEIPNNYKSITKNMNNKSEIFHVRFTKLEADKFKAKAETLGETRGRILRMLTREFINAEPDFLQGEVALLKFALRQLMGMANNLNQITRAMNSGLAVRTLNQDLIDRVQLSIDGFKQALEIYIKYAHFRRVDLARQ